jgi:hemerythrin
MGRGQVALTDYLTYHFGAEEELMREMDFPQME